MSDHFIKPILCLGFTDYNKVWHKFAEATIKYDFFLFIDRWLFNSSASRTGSKLYYSCICLDSYAMFRSISRYFKSRTPDPI